MSETTLTASILIMKMSVRKVMMTYYREDKAISKFKLCRGYAIITVTIHIEKIILNKLTKCLVQ